MSRCCRSNSVGHDDGGDGDVMVVVMKVVKAAAIKKMV